MHKTPNTTRPRCRLALLVVAALAIAACGGDDDTPPDDDPVESDAQTEDSSDEGDEPADESTGEDTTESSDDDTQPDDTVEPDAHESSDEDQRAPDWATNPDLVRDLKDEMPAVPDANTWVQGANPCAFRSDVVALYDPDGAGIDGFEQSENQFGLNEIGVTLLKPVTDPLQDSVALTVAGKFASPMYLVFPAPGRMFFPGSLPVPSAETLPTPPAAIGEEVSVAVVDTGGWDISGQVFDHDQENLENSDVDRVTSGTLYPDKGTPIDDPWTFGHGAFVADIIYRHSGLDVQSFRVRDENGWFDESRVDQQFRRLDGYDVVNVSLGTFPCYVDGGPLIPVITLASMVHRLDADSFVVAAAGNSGDERLTMPAALAGDVSTWGLGWTGAEDELVDHARELLTKLSQTAPTMVAVGAPEDPVHGAEYSTTGAWVTVDDREGCRHASHPGGNISYPDAPASYQGADRDAREAELTEAVYWCGTSFAAPVVAAEIANLLAAGESPEDVRSALGLPSRSSR